MTDQKIKDEILRYIIDYSYNYAVLIDGEWGSGKTYFVKNVLVDAIKSQENHNGTGREVKYISLYGCKSIADVQENIAWSFAENARLRIQDKMNSDNEIDKVSGNILLSSKKIGNAILKKFLPETNLYDIASDWLNLGSFIFVFDDLERSDCPINEFFGFINELVEHENTKVILIANEEELIGISTPQSLENQYLLAVNNEIDWPRPESKSIWGNNRENVSLTLAELERRRNLLFPSGDENTEYRKIKEKVIGVTLRYESDIPTVISAILKDTECSSEIKTRLMENIESFASTMKLYRHRNLRTFQFFVSKVCYLLDVLLSLNIDDYYITDVCRCVILSTFTESVKLKSNYQPPRDNVTWLREEQEATALSIRQYVQLGDFEIEAYTEDVLKIQEQFQANIPTNDPYYLIYQTFYLHTQSWCEEQIERIINQLEDNKYPISFYTKIIVAIQRLLDIGFNPQFMDRIKHGMLNNISRMGEVRELDSDLWYVDDPIFKERVSDIILEINSSIKEHSAIAGRERVEDILQHDDWVSRLEKYVNPNDDRYIQDVIVFSKATKGQWIQAIDKASPADIDDYRHWLALVYPRDCARNSFKEDGPMIIGIYDELKNNENPDLIKRACIGWLCNQLEAIIAVNKGVE